MKQIFANLISLLLFVAPNLPGKAKFLPMVGGLCRGAYIKSKYGVIMQADLKDKTNLWAILGWYDAVANEIKEIESGNAFIDIGANAGVFSMMAAQRVGQGGVVLAFEPQKNIFSKLVANANRNELTNIYCFNLAISNATKPVSLGSTDISHTGTAFLKENTEDSTATTWAVSPRNDLQIIKKMIGNRNTIIKIDVEGHEFSVLEGISFLFESAVVKKLIIEIDHSNLKRFGSTSDEIYSYLDKFGFKATVTSKDKDHYDEVFIRTINA